MVGLACLFKNFSKTLHIKINNTVLIFMDRLQRIKPPVE